MTAKQNQNKSKSEVEFVLEYSGVLSESDLDFIADLFAKVIIERMKRSRGMDNTNKQPVDDRTTKR
jgi:hypothetical protein